MKLLPVYNVGLQDCSSYNYGYFCRNTNRWRFMLCCIIPCNQIFVEREKNTKVDSVIRNYRTKEFRSDFVHKYTLGNYRPCYSCDAITLPVRLCLSVNTITRERFD